MIDWLIDDFVEFHESKFLYMYSNSWMVIWKLIILVSADLLVKSRFQRQHDDAVTRNFLSQFELNLDFCFQSSIRFLGLFWICIIVITNLNTIWTFYWTWNKNFNLITSTSLPYLHSIINISQHFYYDSINFSFHQLWDKLFKKNKHLMKNINLYLFLYSNHLQTITNRI
jgi:hypothetical protein